MSRKKLLVIVFLALSLFVIAAYSRLFLSVHPSAGTESSDELDSQTPQYSLDTRTMTFLTDRNRTVTVYNCNLEEANHFLTRVAESSHMTLRTLNDFFISSYQCEGIEYTHWSPDADHIFILEYKVNEMSDGELTKSLQYIDSILN